MGHGGRPRTTMNTDARVNVFFCKYSVKARMHLVRLHWPAGCNDSILLGISEVSSFPEMESISSPFVVRVAMHVPKTMTGWSTRSRID